MALLCGSQSGAPPKMRKNFASSNNADADVHADNVENDNNDYELSLENKVG
jgi:hypothetical protein